MPANTINDDMMITKDDGVIVRSMDQEKGLESITMLKIVNVIVHFVEFTFNITLVVCRSQDTKPELAFSQNDLLGLPSETVSMKRGAERLVSLCDSLKCRFQSIKIQWSLETIGSSAVVCGLVIEVDRREPDTGLSIRHGINLQPRWHNRLAHTQRLIIGCIGGLLCSGVAIC